MRLLQPLGYKRRGGGTGLGIPGGWGYQRVLSCLVSERRSNAEGCTDGSRTGSAGDSHERPQPTPKRHVSQEARQNMARARLSLKQERFVREYAASGNASSAARKAGYKLSKATHTTGWENLQKPAVKSAIAREIARIELEITPKRVQRRLDEISHEAQSAGQFGPAVRAEELLGGASAC